MRLNSANYQAFTAALETMGKNKFSNGNIPPTLELVNQFFDDSNSTVDRGELNTRGPWNTGGDGEIVEAPAFKELKSEQKGSRLPFTVKKANTVKVSSVN